MTGALLTATPSQAFRRSWWAGLAAHVVSVAVYIGLSALRLEGCDRADGLAAAWGVAILVDLILSGSLLAVALHKGGKGNRTAVWAGWTLSLAPAVVLAILTMSHINSLPSGCG